MCFKVHEKLLKIIIIIFSFLMSNGRMKGMY